MSSDQSSRSTRIGVTLRGALFFPNVWCRFCYPGLRRIVRLPNLCNHLGRTQVNGFCSSSTPPICRWVRSVRLGSQCSHPLLVACRFGCDGVPSATPVLSFFFGSPKIGNTKGGSLPARPLRKLQGLLSEQVPIAKAHKQLHLRSASRKIFFAVCNRDAF